MSPRLLLVHDHAIVRQGIRQLLLDRGVASAVAEADGGQAAVALIDKHEFDAILLDSALAGGISIEVLKRIKRKQPRAPVLMFSLQRDDQYGVRALRAGAAGYLSKPIDIGQMADAIQQVIAGRKYVNPSVVEAIAEYVSHEKEAPTHERLSDREYQTLCMLASGKRLTDIARAMSLSVKTVSVYRTRLLQKMQLSNNAELIRYAMTNQLVDTGRHSEAHGETN
ncbi:response regulator [Burkholderia sp. BC1]|uniref:response regulator n=1 Tax=Burkholderia sp. BC1 TaxID=1095370 RepID=UPI004043F69C